MAWIIYKYHPGFAHDLTSWQTVIEQDGRLTEVVSICLASEEYRSRSLALASNLTAPDTAELTTLIAATDFDAINSLSKRHCVDDAAHISITVCDDAGTRCFHGPLLFWKWIEERAGVTPSSELASALRLWEKIEQLSPWKGRV